MKAQLVRIRGLLEDLPAWECISWVDGRGETHSKHDPSTFRMSLEKWRDAILKEVEALERV